MPQLPIHEAALNGDAITIRSLLDDGVDPNSVAEQTGATPLHLASYNDALECVSILLSSGASPLWKDLNGRTPLHMACMGQASSVVGYLLENGASADRKDKDGKTALFLAAAMGFVGIVDVLLDANANPNLFSAKQWSPLHMAISKGHVQVAALLVEKGANPSAVTEDGSTPLHYAANTGQNEVIRLLLRAGADVNARAAAGVTPLFCSCAHGFVECTEELLKSGGDTSLVLKDGMTVLHTVVKIGQADVIHVLCRYGANVNQPTQIGATPLHIAARVGRTQMVDLLLGYGADPMLQDQMGYTPLDWIEGRYPPQVENLRTKKLSGAQEADMVRLLRSASGSHPSPSSSSHASTPSTSGKASRSLSVSLPPETPAAAETSQVLSDVFAGFLQILVGKKWKKFYFVLKDGQLSQYKGEKDVGKGESKILLSQPVIGHRRIDVLEAGAVPRKTHGFAVVLASKEKILLAAEKEELRQKWMDHLSVYSRSRQRETVHIGSASPPPLSPTSPTSPSSASSTPVVSHSGGVKVANGQTSVPEVQLSPQAAEPGESSLITGNPSSHSGGLKTTPVVPRIPLTPQSPRGNQSDLLPPKSPRNPSPVHAMDLGELQALVKRREKELVVVLKRESEMKEKFREGVQRLKQETKEREEQHLQRIRQLEATVETLEEEKGALESELHSVRQTSLVQISALEKKVQGENGEARNPSSQPEESADTTVLSRSSSSLSTSSEQLSVYGEDDSSSRQPQIEIVSPGSAANSWDSPAESPAMVGVGKLETAPAEASQAWEESQAALKNARQSMADMQAELEELKAESARNLAERQALLQPVLKQLHAWAGELDVDLAQRLPMEADKTEAAIASGTLLIGSLLADQMAALQEQLSQANAAGAVLQQQCQQKDEAVEQLTQSQKELSEEKEGLHDALWGKDAELKEAQAAMGKLEEQLSGMESSWLEKEDGWKAQKRDLSQELESVRTLLQERDFEGLEQTVQQHVEEKQELESKVLSLQTSLDTNAQELAALRVSHEDFQNTAAKKESALSESLSQARAELEKSQLALEESLSTSTDVHTQKERDMRALEETAEQHLKDKQELESKVLSLQTSLDANAQQLSFVQDQWKEREEELQALLTTSEEEKNALAAQYAQLQALQTADSGDTADHVLELTEALESTRKELNQHRQDSARNESVLTQKLRTAQADTHAALEQAKDLQKQVALNESKLSVGTLAGDNSNEGASAAEKDNDIVGLKKQIANLRTSSDALHAQVLEQENELKSLRRELQLRTEELELVRKSAPASADFTVSHIPYASSQNDQHDGTTSHVAEKEATFVGGKEKNNDNLTGALEIRERELEALQDIIAEKNSRAERREILIAEMRERLLASKKALQLKDEQMTVFRNELNDLNALVGQISLSVVQQETKMSDWKQKVKSLRVENSDD
jgi:ankyrin repeat protein